jgi:hypothetical protein
MEFNIEIIAPVNAEYSNREVKRLEIVNLPEPYFTYYNDRLCLNQEGKDKASDLIRLVLDIPETNSYISFDSKTVHLSSTLESFMAVDSIDIAFSTYNDYQIWDRKRKLKTLF